MTKTTNPAYPDWSNPQSIIVVANESNPKKVKWQPYVQQRSDLCQCEIEFHTYCATYFDYFNTKTAEEKTQLNQELGRQLAWDRAIEVAEMLWQKNVAAHRTYERYAVYFRPEDKSGYHREVVCICSVLNGNANEC